MSAILVSKNDGTPEWVTAMARVQFAMWVDEGAICAWCKQPYTSVDDFIARNPRAGYHWADPDLEFVDSACWDAYDRNAAAKAAT